MSSKMTSGMNFNGPARGRPKLHPNKNKKTFSHIGGLAQHLNTLREIVIMPLLYGDLYKHFNIKPPKGVLFYGPPGTGKTLMAGALAAEIGNQAGGKVVFYHRKGADILDKWVGESERKLRELFEKARKTRPSLIFFDEIDGLAPERSARNDHVHASIVTTLLALMDGLDDSSGVVVIGATNRIECVDSALRRPGRFDRELYFPLPNARARKEILEVHTKTWRHKPSPEFLERFSGITSGCCGSDLQAICAEAVLCSVKRLYPNVTKTMKAVDLKILRVTEEDFSRARVTITPSINRSGNCRMRKLTPFIRPLLERQVNKIVSHMHIVLPHFLDETKQYVGAGDRYAGRLILRGDSHQGVNNYVVPALLQRFEHLHINILDNPDQYSKVISNSFHCMPSVIVLSRVDDWWDELEANAQMAIVSMLESLHAGLPILLIVTYNGSLPPALHQHFVSNSSILVEVDNPTLAERREFFAPLFFGKTCISMWLVLHGGITSSTKREVDENEEVIFPQLEDKDSSSRRRVQGNTRVRKSSGCVCKRLVPPRTLKLNTIKKRRLNHVGLWLHSIISRSASLHEQRSNVFTLSHVNLPLRASATSSIKQSQELVAEHRIVELWKRTTDITSVDLPVVNLELLYDALLASIYIDPNNFEDACNETLTSFEKI